MWIGSFSGWSKYSSRSDWWLDGNIGGKPLGVQVNKWIWLFSINTVHTGTVTAWQLSYFPISKWYNWQLDNKPELSIGSYTVMWVLCAFSLVDCDLLKRWHQIHVRSRQQTCFTFFMPQKSFNKPLEFLLYKTNRLLFSVCVYSTVIDHRRCHSV